MFRKASLILFLLALVSGFAFGQEPEATPSPEPKKANQRPENEYQPPPEPYDKASIDELRKCVAFDTEKGLIEVEMFPDTAPITVRNFLNLVGIGALNNTTFSRVVPGFVIQGGDLYTNKEITTQFMFRAVRNVPDEPNLVRHQRGIISMARGEEANSATTHFFILVADATTLDNKFAAFGKVAKGMDLVDAINKAEVENEKPKEPVLIKTAKVVGCTEGGEQNPE
ncbi:MAG: peptidylprolyl isomerase [Pyrinomonadaceae bacterium]